MGSGNTDFGAKSSLQYGDMQHVHSIDNRIGRLETIVESLTDGVRRLTDGMTASGKANLATMASWAAVVVTIAALVIGPLYTAQSDIQATLKKHAGDGHPEKVLARVDDIETVLDDLRRTYIADLREQIAFHAKMEMAVARHDEKFGEQRVYTDRAAEDRWTRSSHENYADAVERRLQVLERGKPDGL